MGEPEVPLALPGLVSGAGGSVGSRSAGMKGSSRLSLRLMRIPSPPLPDAPSYAVRGHLFIRSMEQDSESVTSGSSGPALCRTS